MYAPAPPRPKKTSIVRSRTGCKGCRERRTKCDEVRPVCGTCARLKTACKQFNPKFEFRQVTATNLRVASESTCESEKSSTAFNASRGQVPCVISTGPLQRSERDIFYSAYWEYECLPTLHPSFRLLANHGPDFLALQDAVLALSSCNLSRRDSESRRGGTVVYMGSQRPNPIHQVRSQQYYSLAVGKITKLSHDEYRRHLPAVVMSVIIFAHIESTRGNLQGFYCHMNGLTALSSSGDVSTKHDHVVKDFITAWMRPNFQVWWARAYFSTLEVQRRQPRVPIPPMLSKILETRHEPRTAILSIMCESHRLNVTILLNCWKYHDDHKEMHHQAGTLESCHNTNEVFALLAEQSLQSDEWLRNLPIADQPVRDGNINSLITFQSHDAALNYAYYILARIMQCTEIFEIFDPRDHCGQGRECHEAESWIRLLLEVVEGIDMRKCFYQNNYTIGFSGLLLAALLRCQDDRSCRRIERWLHALEAMQPTEEGSFPVYQALSVTRAINQQRSMGRDVFAVSQPFDDGGGFPKLHSYNSQVIDTLLIHGRCRINGIFFTENVLIDGR